MQRLTWHILHFLSISEAKCNDKSSNIASLVLLRQLAISSSLSPVLTCPILSPSSSNSCISYQVKIHNDFKIWVFLKQSRIKLVVNVPHMTCYPHQVWDPCIYQVHRIYLPSSDYFGALQSASREQKLTNKMEVIDEHHVLLHSLDLWTGLKKRLLGW